MRRYSHNFAINNENKRADMLEGNDESIFTRQRRNLIISSLFVIFYASGNLEISQISILGNTAKIGNPQIIYFILGLFYVYFFWRYYTVCRDVRGYYRFIESWRKHYRGNRAIFSVDNYYVELADKRRNPAADSVHIKSAKRKYFIFYQVSYEYMGDLGSPL